MNDKDNVPEVPFTTYPYLHLYSNTTNKVNDGKIARLIAATSNPTSLTLT